MSRSEKTPIDIVPLRLQNQQLINTNFSTAKEIVSWMGAMQSQDYGMAKLAIGIRLVNATDETVEKAIGNGEIIRTHLLRPTWHFVSPDDLHWMLALTATRVKAAMKTNDKRLGLDESIFKKTNKIIEKLLGKNDYALRDTIVAALLKAKIDSGENRLAHYLMRAELDGIACNGPTVGKQRSYAMIDKWAPIKRKFSTEESLAMLATKYFQSHGPATLADFVWWSGLTNRDAKHAVEMIRKDFESITIASQVYLHKPFNGSHVVKAPSAILLPAFDEFIIAYTDRSAAFAREHHSIVVSTNGIFRSVIIAKSKVAGLWKRTLQNDKLVITTEWFKKPTGSTSGMRKAAEKIRHFYEAKSIDILSNNA